MKKCEKLVVIATIIKKVIIQKVKKCEKLVVIIHLKDAHIYGLELTFSHFQQELLLLLLIKIK